MHKMRNDLNIGSGPQTTGVPFTRPPNTILHTGLVGLGVNGSNSRTIVEMAKIKP